MGHKAFLVQHPYVLCTLDFKIAPFNRAVPLNVLFCVTWGRTFCRCSVHMSFTTCSRLAGIRFILISPERNFLQLYETFWRALSNSCDSLLTVLKRMVVFAEGHYCAHNASNLFATVPVLTLTSMTRSVKNFHRLNTFLSRLSSVPVSNGRIAYCRYIP